MNTILVLVGISVIGVLLSSFYKSSKHRKDMDRLVEHFSQYPDATLKHIDAFCDLNGIFKETSNSFKELMLSRNPAIKIDDVELKASTPYITVEPSWYIGKFVELRNGAESQLTSGELKLGNLVKVTQMIDSQFEVLTCEGRTILVGLDQVRKR